MLYSTQNITRLGKLTLVESLLKRKQYAKALEIYIAHIDRVGFSDRFYERAWSVYCELGAYIKRDSKKIVPRKEKPLQTNVSLNLLEVEATANVPEPAEEADRKEIDPDVASDPCPIQGTEESTLPKEDEAEDTMDACCPLSPGLASRLLDHANLRRRAGRHVLVIEGGRRVLRLSDPVPQAGFTVIQSDSPRTTEPATNISHRENAPKNSGSPVADEELIESFAKPTAVTTQPLKKSLSRKQRLMPWLCCRREQTISIG